MELLRNGAYKMREIIQLDLQCRKNGKTEEKLIKIEFICNKATTLYKHISKVILEINDLSKESSALDQKLKTVESIEEKTRDHDRSILEIKAKSKEISNKIEQYLETDFFEKRMELVLLIMEGNPSSDPDLTDRNFWDTCVEPPHMRMFLDEAIQKDYIYLKKKAVVKRKTKRSMKKG
jgi:hypothetical protein